ncbi:AEC family transporter [Dorea longicatena]|uniref:AEC family transporter n=1 Tax=Dorea longicatena TaxID=88431 RepID=UPI001D002C4E|nr:AEC family transporter [Dorea longicatena]MCB5537465.1 AEC family transporter [bacterium MSK17_88]MCB5547986.1 AEC family transporter [Dorea longicatena]MCG4575802.1 AEC family transporter [Dorea longicatena]
MENIIVSFNVIAPVFFLMVLGYLLVNYTSLADRKLTKQANAIVFKIFLPCMLFYNVYQSDIGAEIHSRIKLCIWAAGGLLILFVLLCLIVPKVVKQENQQGVVIQGIFRSNYVIFGVAVVQNMYGVKSTTTAAILSAILVPMYNFLAVVVLSIFGEKRETDWKKIILDIVKNPLIISSVLGIIFSLLGIRLPTAVDTTVQDLAKLSTPIAFMILGGDLDFSKVRGNLKVASVVLTIKLVILPLIMIPLIVMMGYRDADLLSGLLAYQTPVAVSSYIMAQQAGADGQLAGQLVVFSSVLSIFTLFVTILILRTIGLLGI